MGYHLSPQAATDLEDIWDYIARESGNAATATRQIQAIALRFRFLANHPFAGRARDDDLGPGRRSFPTHHHIIVYRVIGG